MPVEPKNFSTLIKGLKAAGVKGFNITVPYKSNIMPFCDKVDSLAKTIGAVNTVVEKNGKWEGKVTDPFGFRKSIETSFKGFSLRGKRILLLGAGGAALSVAYVCLTAGNSQLVVMNRTKSKAEALIQRMKKAGFTRCSCTDYNHDILLSDNRFDLLINSTSSGLRKEDRAIISLSNTEKKMKVYDLIYNPSMTPLLKEAKKEGLLYANGLSMLIYQAFQSFSFWTGVEPTEKDARDISSFF